MRGPFAPIALVALSVPLVGCQADIAGSVGPGSAGAGPIAGVPGASGTGGGGGVPEPLPGELNAPFTRLTRAEYQATIRAAFELEAPVTGIPGDQRVGPFTSNLLDPDPAHQFLLASEDLAAALVPRKLPVCSGAGAASCVAMSYQAPLERLFRRPLTTAEVSQRAELVTALEGAGVPAEAATRAMLVSAFMSADFLFRASPFSAEPVRVRLAEHLSYALVDAPPDAVLLGAGQASADELGPKLKEKLLACSRTAARCRCSRASWRSGCTWTWTPSSRTPPPNSKPRRSTRSCSPSPSTRSTTGRPSNHSSTAPGRTAKD